MSTRSQIIIKDVDSELWFYRHCDGYPIGNLPTLRKILNWVKEGKLRNNVDQTAGWLILEGAKEYASHFLPETEIKNPDFKARELKAEKILLKNVQPIKSIMGWQCGAYEPCSCRELHGDVKWLYTVDLAKKEILIKQVDGKEVKDDPELSPEDVEKLFN